MIQYSNYDDCCLWSQAHASHFVDCHKHSINEIYYYPHVIDETSDVPWPEVSQAMMKSPHMVAGRAGP